MNKRGLLRLALELEDVATSAIRQGWGKRDAQAREELTFALETLALGLKLVARLGDKSRGARLVDTARLARE